MDAFQYLLSNNLSQVMKPRLQLRRCSIVYLLKVGKSSYVLHDLSILQFFSIFLYFFIKIYYLSKNKVYRVFYLNLYKR